MNYAPKLKTEGITSHNHQLLAQQELEEKRITSLLELKCDELKSQKKYSDCMTVAFDFLNNYKNSKHVEARAYRWIGIVFYLQKNFQQSIQYFVKSLELLVQLQDAAEQCQAVFYLGTVNHRMGNREEAIQLFEKALLLCETKVQDNSAMRVDILQGLAQIYESAQQSSKALEYYEKSLTILKLQRQQQDMYADCLIKTSIIYGELGKHSEALQAQDQALRVYQHLKFQEGISRTYNMMGITCSKLGTIPKALKHYKLALSSYALSEDAEGKASVYFNMGNAYTSSADYTNAVEHYEKSIIFRQALDDAHGLAQVFHNLGIVYHKLGKLGKSLDYYQKALEIFQKGAFNTDTATTLNHMAEISFKLSKYEESRDYYLKSSSLPDVKQDVRAKTWTGIGISYFTMKDYAKSKECHEKALELRRLNKDIDGELETLNYLALSCKKLNQNPVALKYFEQLYKNIVEKYQLTREKKHIEKLRACCSLIQQCLLNMGDFDQSLAIAEQERFLLYMRDNEDIREFSYTMIQEFANQEESQVVFYSLGATHLHIWLLQDKLHFRSVAYSSILGSKATVQSILEVLATTACSSLYDEQVKFCNALATLYKLFIGPIASLLFTFARSKLIIVTQGLCTLIPYSALFDDVSDKYLIESFDITVTEKWYEWKAIHQQTNAATSSKQLVLVSSQSAKASGICDAKQFKQVRQVVSTVDASIEITELYEPTKAILLEKLAQQPTIVHVHSPYKQDAFQLQPERMSQETLSSIKKVMQGSPISSALSPFENFSKAEKRMHKLEEAKMNNLSSNSLLDSISYSQSNTATSADYTLYLHELAAVNMKQIKLILFTQAECLTLLQQNSTSKVDPFALFKSLELTQVACTICSLWRVQNMYMPFFFEAFYKNMSDCTISQCLREAILAISSTFGIRKSPWIWGGFCAFGTSIKI